MEEKIINANHMHKPIKKKAVSLETFVTLGFIILLFGYMGSKMGIDKVFSVMMKTAHDVFLNTSLYITGVATLAGAFSYVLSEFGVIALINKILAPIMRPLFGLPGAAALGAVTCYTSDNPGILALVSDEGYNKYFTKSERLTHVNFGTVFGMGLIVTAYMLSLGSAYFKAVLIGNIGAILGGIVSVRLMLRYGKKVYKEDASHKIEFDNDALEDREIRPGGILERLLNSLLQGANSGFKLGISACAGTMLVCTMVMMLTFGPAGEGGQYLGQAYEGVALLPKIGAYFLPAAKVLWGFQHSELLAFPFTALGAVGSAMGLTTGLLQNGLADANTVATFTGMGICLSGFLSTHVGMLDALKQGKYSTKAISYHLIGGLAAGVFANYLFKLTMLI
ncbi:MAG: CD0519/CD1768 family membrane protein [Anaerococcus sp.]